MAFVTARGNGSWEVRESYATANGPRSRTLATFRTLTADVVSRACSRANGPLDAEDLRTAARRAGAPVAASASDRACAELLAELAAGRTPRPALARLLVDSLRGLAGSSSDNARAAAAWIAATPQQRGAALRDLLLLADRLPSRRRAPRTSFPRIASGPA